MRSHATAEGLRSAPEFTTITISCLCEATIRIVNLGYNDRLKLLLPSP
jgi:hypothetical protein